MNKRSFIKNMSLLSALPAFKPIDQLLHKYNHLLPAELAEEENFWKEIRDAYRIKPDYINLENGYYCFMPEEILEHLISHMREVNYHASNYMRTKRLIDKKNIAGKLAEIAGCSAEELIITRNTTESLDLVIGGTSWKEADEAVMAEQDYGSMRDMFKLVAARYGVVNKIISVPLHPANDEEIVNLYASAITPKTKLLMVSHIINITGQILPVRKICDMAHSKGVKVLVDGAHAFAHFRFSIQDLDCDYYGTSLHKWLSAPLGAGFLYVKKENIPGIWPLMGSGTNTKPDDISRLNHIGTHPAHTDLSILNAINFYMKIGPEKKEARLRYLQRYWSDKARNIPGVIVNTPADPLRSCGIANVGITKMKPAELAETLMKKYNIFTVAIDTSNVHGCRITPNVYTSTSELDVLVKGLKEMAG